MQKQKENRFLDKFRLLNSQEHTEEIIWSLSDSSEYEETSVNDKLCNLTNRARILKRKRKKKAPKNISNLSITVRNTSKDIIDLQSGETSPILVSKNPKKSFCLSPILVATQLLRPANSPVLPSKSTQQKSPILALKAFSPKNVGSSKKRLFSPVRTDNIHKNKKSSESHDNIVIKTEVLSVTVKEKLTCPVTKIDRFKEENTSTAKLELAKRIKTYFDSHFSPESSQNSHSISDIQTQKSSTKNSDEIILSCKTNTPSNESLAKKSIQENLSDLSAENSFYTFNKTKKVRYKKNGLAHRLDNLLRKQNSCLSLWHHERYLEANSNFIIPKGEHSLFRIQKVHYQYGCYLIEAVDLNFDAYLILINGCYVSNKILTDVIIKVYYPYKIIQYDSNTKLLINVCRFEFSDYKK